MNESPDELRQRIAVLEERLSGLHAAVTRVSASLDLGTVLQEVVDRARELTGAPYGVILREDETGRILDLVTSGFAPEQHEEIVSLVRSNTLQCTPMRHRGAYVGSFFLAEKEAGHEFTKSDEEVLVLFASQAAAAIANACAHRDERRARADLEAVVETSPLEELERQRAEFLSMVSHELRAPLISIKGSTATVLGAAPAPDPAGMLQFFRVIDDQANQMRNLLADLLDQGRIAAGTLSVSVERAEVAGLIDQARSTSSFAGSGRAVTIDLPEDLPRVLADPGRIVQVLNNLLSNAALHSPDLSPIAVAASLEDDYVAISVTDRGSGVPPEKLPHLFRKHAGATGGKGVGYGLGLVICKGIVEAHGGRIWAASDDDGHGTRFTFTLPVAEEACDAAPSRASRQPRSPNRNRATPILVVDDDPQTLQLVRDVLAEAGYAPVLTGDPDELPGLIRTHRPRLVLLDLVLPGTDGLELMENVPELVGLPIIFISVYGRDETIARALDAGAADYIVKPLSPLGLTARVRAALRR